MKKINFSYITDYFKEIDIRRFGKSLKRLFAGFADNTKSTFINAYIEDEDGAALSRRRILYGNIFANLAAIMTGGVFFTGLILILLEGETEAVRNSYLGDIVSIQVLCGISQLLGPLIIERMKKRRVFVLITRLIYYVVNVLLLALVPLVPADAQTKVVIFIGLVVVMQVSLSLSSPAIGIWHISNIPENKRADYFSLQNMILPIINVVTSIVCGIVIDNFKAGGAELVGILLLRGAAILVVVLESKSFFRVDEPVYEVSKKKMSLLSIFTVPFKHPQFLMVTLICFLWTLAAYISGQYFTAYLLKDIEMSYTFINFCGIFNIPILILMTPIWNMIVHRIGWLPTLSLSLALYTVPYLLNVFVTGDTIYVYLICVIYCNIVAPGINLAFANLPHLKMPAENKSSCLAFYSAIGGGIAGFVGTWVGKTFMELTDGVYIEIFSQQVKNSRYINLLPMILIALIAILVFFVNRADKRRQKI